MYSFYNYQVGVGCKSVADGFDIYLHNTLDGGYRSVSR